MNSIVLQDKVKIKPNGLVGEVRGIWSSVNDATQYYVQYADSTGRLANDWLYSDQFEVIPSPTS